MGGHSMRREDLEKKIRHFHNLLSTDLPNALKSTLTRLLREAEAELRDHEKGPGSSLAPSPDIDTRLLTIAESAIDEAMRMHGAQFGNLQIYDPETESLRIIAHRNFEAPFLEHFAIVGANDNSACARCLADGARVIIEDVAVEPSFRPHMDIALESGFRAVQSTPLHGPSGRLMAVLSTHFAMPRQFTTEECAELDLCATRTALAMARHLSG